MKITLIQSDLHWENITANLATFEEKIWHLSGQTDVIVLPEMFNTGYSMDTSLAEPMNLTTFKWLRQMANQTGAVVTGSYMVSEKEHYYNRMVWMRPDGNFSFYDKKHLFGLAGENQFFTSGNQKIVVEWKGWRFCPMICYDLRFPVWSRNESPFYDCVLYIASWASPRHLAWQTLLQARAIENLSYSIGVNRVGKDAENHEFLGGSAVYAFSGETIFEATHQEIIQTCVLDKEALADYRNHFRFHEDADAFSLS
ncbi:MAG: amidohydrolase [Verrucomicrobia bacterium]|nr:amidohydrolase [Cytophagales bacterium]